MLDVLFVDPATLENQYFTNLILNNIFEFEKIYIQSPRLHRDLYHKLNNCSINYIPNHIIPNILNEDEIELVIEQMVTDKDFEKSGCEIDTYDGIDELKYTQEYNSDSRVVIILDAVNEKRERNKRSSSASYVQTIYT